MNITPISMNTFRGPAKYAAKPFTVIRPDEIIQSVESKPEPQVEFIKNMVAKGYNSLVCSKELDINGIKDVQAWNNSIRVQSKSGHSLRIKPDMKIDVDLIAKAYVINDLKNKNNLYGIPAFIKCVSHFGRFDLIKKGLGLSGNELTPVPKDMKEKTAKQMSKLINKRVGAGDLFCTESEAYYPDIHNNTIYGARITQKKLHRNDIRTCKFLLDGENNVIGYDLTKYDILKNDLATTSYKEQQEPSEILDSAVDVKNLKQFAEACRFGNYKLSSQHASSMDIVLGQLKSGGVKDATSDKLNGVRYVNDDKRNTMITYFNPKTGRSIIFDKNGKYLGQVEYFKNINGEIDYCCVQN